MVCSGCVAAQGVISCTAVPAIEMPPCQLAHRYRSRCRAPPADSDQVFRQTCLGVEIAAPHRSGAVVQCQLVPPRGAVQRITGGQFISVTMDFVAHPVSPAAQQPDRPNTGGSPGASRPQPTTDVTRRQRGSQHAGQAAEAAEYVGSWCTATGPAAVLVTGRAGTEPKTSRQGVLEEPGAAAPRRMDLDEAFQIRVMPIEDGATTADVRDQQIRLGVLFVGGEQLGHRPGLRSGALPVIP